MSNFRMGKAEIFIVFSFPKDIKDFKNQLGERNFVKIKEKGAF